MVWCHPAENAYFMWCLRVSRLMDEAQSRDEPGFSYLCGLPRDEAGKMTQQIVRLNFADLGQEDSGRAQISATSSPNHEPQNAPGCNMRSAARSVRPGWRRDNQLPGKL